MKVYAFKNNEETIMTSSSGGAFVALAMAVWELGSKDPSRKSETVFFGAAFDDDLRVRHIGVSSIDQLYRLQGSKYVQSDISGCFLELQRSLLEGKKVVFSGTPCQVVSVKKYCENKKLNLDNLYCIDLICHGTPEPKLWDDFVEWLEKRQNSKLVEFSFRCKRIGWRGYPVYARFADGREKKDTYDVRTYTALFFSHLTMRECCYNCRYSNMNRQGDITIGDFWGIEELQPDFGDKKGVSEIIVNTNKGIEIMNIVLKEKVKMKYNVVEVHGLDFIRYQNNLQRPTEKPEHIDVFRRDYKERGFDYIAKKYAGRNMKNRMKLLIKNILRKLELWNK